jgi:hypothetical protein
MTTPTCPGCGEGVSPGLVLCPHCGSPLWGMPTTALPLATELTTPTTNAPAVTLDPSDAPRGAAVDQPMQGDSWVCPTCRRTVTGPSCDFDGTPHPRPRRPGQSEAGTSPAVIDIWLPDGTVVSLAEQQPLDLGRHSPNPQVAASLRDYDGVSRRHATLTVSGGQVTVVDHDSVNGTRLNGIQVSGACSLPLEQARTLHLGRRAVLHLARPSADPC